MSGHYQDLRPDELRKPDSFVSVQQQTEMYRGELRLVSHQLRQLTHCQALESAPHIQLLYLQNNKITRMSGFDKLKKLRKLYLTRNKIQVLEGLVENKALEELHVDRQLLRPGEHFVMDPRTCQAMANCLKSLNISGSNCHDLAGLHLMTALQSLSAANNHIALLDPVVEVVTNLRWIIKHSHISLKSFQFQHVDQPRSDQQPEAE